MSENIQSKLFNTFLAWDNNEIVWFAETEPKDDSEASMELEELSIHAGQLVLELGYES